MVRWLVSQKLPRLGHGHDGRPTCLQSSAPQTGGAQSLVVTGGVRCIRWQAVQGGSAGSRPRAQGPSWSRMQIVLSFYFSFLTWSTTFFTQSFEMLEILQDQFKGSEKKS